MNDSRDDQSSPGTPGNGYSLLDTLLWVNTSKEEKVVIRVVGDTEGRDVDTVMDRGQVVEGGMTVRFADGNVVRPAVVFLVDGQNPFAGETVDCRHHRRRHQSAVGKGKEVEAVVDEIELASTLEYLADVQAFPHLHVNPGRL